MEPNENGTHPGRGGHSRREFLRVSGTMAAASALASAGCQPPQEATVPFHDMPESLVDGLGRARFFATVLDGSPVLVRTREGRPILVTPNPKDASGRGTSRAPPRGAHGPLRPGPRAGAAVRAPREGRRRGELVVGGRGRGGRAARGRARPGRPADRAGDEPVAAGGGRGDRGADGPAARGVRADRVLRRGPGVEGRPRRRPAAAAAARQGGPRRRLRRGVPRPARGRPRGRLREAPRARSDRTAPA